ncbi:hypothetical protein ANN_13093 [Periplaneta americana]|uniref:Uncharacterized protein n=1 Tax=Periplaneta americana TaxID=6978 RepID=A0ABQ8TIW3_PERAM|nr:hypothetical protein ANN_13093 [Periplaneta americana]
MGEERMMLKLIRRRKRNWSGHWLRRDCLLKDALEGMVNGRKVRVRIRYQMINDIKIVDHMRRLRGKQKIGKIGECWVCSERPAHGQNTYVEAPCETGLNKGKNCSGAGHRSKLGSGVLSAHLSCIDIKGTIVTVSCIVPRVAQSKIFGAKRDEVTGEWRKLHNAELHALYSSPDVIRNTKWRRLKWAEHVARMGESRNAYRVLVGRPEGKRPLRRPKCRWEDNIEMDLREVGYDDREWINLARTGTNDGLMFERPDVVIQKPLHNARVTIWCAMSSHGILSPYFVEDAPQNSKTVNKEEEKELAGSLVEKKLPTEGCTGRNDEREKSSGQKKISDDRRH